MKKSFKIGLILLLCVLPAGCFFGCEKQKEVYRFTAPEGTPALAFLRLPVDNPTISGHAMQYEVVSPSNISAEMTSQKSDIVIMPVNAGAKLITQGVPYKLAGIAVNGSLFLIGKGEESTQIEDLVGKKIACIGQTGVPGLVFRAILAQYHIHIVTEGTPNKENREIFVRYVADGAQAKVLLADNESGIDFAVVGEPAVTVLANALSCKTKIDLQKEYARFFEAETYPQAGIFVKTSLYSDKEWLEGLFSALQSSKEWVRSHPEEVTAFAQENVYESALFPTKSIENCAIDCQRIGEEERKEVMTFLKTVMPSIAWDDYADTIF